MKEFIATLLRDFKIPLKAYLYLRADGGIGERIVIRDLIERLVSLSAKRQQRIMKFMKEHANDRIQFIRCLTHLARPIVATKV